MVTVYLLLRCYEPNQFHFGWLFGFDDVWYAGSLDMPQETEPAWRPRKQQLASFGEALHWFNPGGHSEQPGANIKAPYCGYDAFEFDVAANIDAGRAAHRAAGTGENSNSTGSYNCYDGAEQVLMAFVGSPGQRLGTATKALPRTFLMPRPVKCTGICGWAAPEADPPQRTAR